MTNHWYAIRSKPNKEDFLARQLEAIGLEVFFPRITASPKNPRARKVKPYFPGYLFVHVDLTLVNASTLQWTPGAGNLVSFGGEPASIPDVLITTLQKRLPEVNASITKFKNLKPGESVLVTDGPFAGYEAIFDSAIPGRDRVRVLLNFLQTRQVLVELKTQQITLDPHDR